MMVLPINVTEITTFQIDFSRAGYSTAAPLEEKERIENEKGHLELLW